MTSFKDLIGLWPTQKAFSDDLGISLQSATNMITRDSVAGRYWLDMVTGAQRRGIKGVSLDALAAAAAAKKAKEAAARKVPA